MTVLLGNLSLDDSPLGEPEGMLLKIHSGSESAPQVFDVSGVTRDSGFSRTGRCLSSAPVTGLKESQKFITIVQICIIILERMILTTRV